MTGPDRSPRSWPAVVVTVIVCGALGGCSAPTPSPAPTPAAAPHSPVTSALPGPLTEVRPTLIGFGQAGRLPGSVAISVTDPVVRRDALGAWIAVHLVLTNPTRAPITVPDIGLLCINNAEPGNLQADSSVGDATSVPAGRTIRGSVNLLTPGDRRYAASAPLCDTPSYVQWTAPYTPGAIPPAFRVRVPDTVIAQLNAQRFVLPS